MSKKEKGAIVLLFSSADTLEGIAIDSATEKQTQTLQKFLKENFRKKQILNLSGNPNPKEGKIG